MPKSRSTAGRAARRASPILHGVCWRRRKPRSARRRDAMLSRIGLLGAGKVARHHAKALAAAGATIVAASTRRADSPNWKPFRAEAPGARFVADGAALLIDNEVEGIVVSLP